MSSELDNGRSFGDILGDTREELKEFVETRITILKSELSEKAAILKVAAPLGAVGLLFLFAAFILFSLALAGIIVAFVWTNPFRWAIAFACIGVLWTIIGGVAALAAKRKLATSELMPKRTMGVLKQDKVWIQSEVKNQI
jgi:uncharacterized membrane protein YqjE